MPVRSLNPAWTVADFHARTARLAGLREGERVLDLGCGRGVTLPYLLAGVGRTGEVIAADRAHDGLQAIRVSYADDIANGRLTLVDLDVSRPLPFEASSLDRVICQNVIECVSGREGLLAEIYRILRPGGSALIGHHDFDGVFLANDDREMTRRMVHGYADHTQCWQDVSEGQMGRLLPGLFTNSWFQEAETETLLFVDLVLTKESYARDHLDAMVTLSEQFGMPAASAENWLRSLEVRSDTGLFYYAVPWTYVVARKL